MKKLLTLLLGIVTGALLSAPFFASALSTFLYVQGGTGSSTIPAQGQVFYAGAVAWQSEATGTITCSGGSSCGAGSYVLGNNLSLTSTFGTTSLSALFPIIYTQSASLAQFSFGGLTTSTPAVIGNIPYFTGVNTFGNVATTTVTCASGNTCTPFTVIGTTPITINGPIAVIFPFTPTTNYGAPANATTTPIWFQGTPFSLFASSTAVFVNATTTLLSVANFADFLAPASAPAQPPAGSSRLSSATVHGFTALNYLNEDATAITLGRDNVVIVKNTTGSTITKGSVVYITGSSGNTPLVTPALSIVPTGATLSQSPLAVVIDDIANNAFGEVMTVGLLSGINTSAFTSGDSLWISTTTAGALVNYRPKAPYSVSRIGSVLVSGVGNGSIEVVVAPYVGGIEFGTSQNTYTIGSWLQTVSDTLSFSNQSGTTSETVNPTTNNWGISSTTPFAEFSINSLVGNTNTTLFAVGSSTQTATTTLFTIGNTGITQALDAATNFFGILSPVRALAMQTGSTTAWQGTTSNPYIPSAIAPFAGTIKDVKCATDASFLGVEVDINGTAVTPSYFVASTTKGVITLTAGNTFVYGDSLSFKAGTTTTATATTIFCTLRAIQTS